MNEFTTDTNNEELDVNRCLKTIEKILYSINIAQRDGLRIMYGAPWYLTTREKNYVLETFDGLGYKIGVRGHYDILNIPNRHGWCFNIMW